MRALAGIGDRIVSRLWMFLATAALLQIAFTALIRGLVVPVLTPGRHWMFGLQRDTDSHFFFNEAVNFRRYLDARGWEGLNEALAPGQAHIKIFAAAFYAQGANVPWLIYAIDTVLFVLTVWLLARIQQTVGVPTRRARAVALLLGASPMLLFAYSEMLREPFIVPFALIFALGLATIGAASQQGIRWTMLLGGAVGLSFGFVGLATFRPYLMLLALGGLGASAAVLAAQAIGGEPRWRLARLASPATLVALSGLLLILVVAPSQGEVQAYKEGAIADATAAEREVARLRSGVQQEMTRLATETERPTAKGASGVTATAAVPSAVAGGLSPDGTPLPRLADRKLFEKTRGCTVQWRRTAWLPASLDRKFEAMACVRDEYQLYCDQSVYGPYADRNCDAAVLSSTIEILAHQPRSLWYAMWTPYPSMWFTSFGAGGTGLRRVGYVIDGVVSYVCLAGLLLGMWQQRRNAAYLSVAIAGLTILTVYATAVPSQFIFMRMRIGVYLPLLALGGAAIATALISSGERRRTRPDLA
jgi:hypothetical protein